MHEIDGGEGGGQILRTALSYALVTGDPVTVEDVRGARPEPGLKPQHLTAVDLAASICDADVAGAELGSESVVFEPGDVSGGRYEVDVGTAGSVGLVFDTVLPAAVRLDQPLRVTARGGTHVKWAPPLTFYDRVKVPILRRVGLVAALEVDAPGFYPNGGGVATLHLGPSSLSPLDLDERGDLEAVGVRSLASTGLADDRVAERQADAAVAALTESGIEVAERTVTYADAECPGSALLVDARYGRTRTGFDALGERGVPAEGVAADAVEAFDAFRRTDAAVDRHLADQLMVFLALAGGSLRIPAVTDHVETSLSLLESFGMAVDVSREADPLLQFKR